MRKILIVLFVLTLLFNIGCQRQASKVSYNLSKEADNFNIVRQLTVMSLFTNDVLFQMTGRLSIENINGNLEIVVKDNANTYRKHFVYLGDNLSYVVEDLGLGDNDVSNYRYTLNYNPKMWIPVDIKTID